MSEVVRRYYDGCVEVEWNRLTSAYRAFELLSTLRLIDEYFPKEGRVADVGGGPGRYAVELVRRGYQVTLVDLAEEAVAFARAKLAELHLHADRVEQADARDLGRLKTASFDAGLLLGPLYHLVEPRHRRRALEEFRRILKPGAPGIVGFINPWGILRSGLEEFPNCYTDRDYIRQLLGTTVAIGEQSAFTEAAFLTPPQALAEIRDAGFAVETRAGVEGFASGMFGAVARMAEEDPAAYANVRELVVETSTSPTYRDCTEHLHVVVRRIA
jgi:S-adenosylmethionine-dependent methyltransferase